MLLNLVFLMQSAIFVYCTLLGVQYLFIAHCWECNYLFFEKKSKYRNLRMADGSVLEYLNYFEIDIWQNAMKVTRLLFVE